MPANVSTPLSPSTRVLTRLFLLVFLLVGELLFVSFRYDSVVLLEQSSWFQWLGYSSKALRIGVVFLVAFPLAIGPHLREHYDKLLKSATDNSFYWPLLAQLVVYAVFLLITQLIFDNPSSANSFPALLPVFWVLLMPLIFGLWLITIAPSSHWLDLVRQERIAIAVAGLVALAALGVAELSQQLWGPLGELTFDTSAWLLGLVYSDVVADANQRILGTQQFLVEIGSQCSGYEGIGLVIVFSSFYLSMFRRDFRFPQALLLFPIGIATIWVFNAVRIALLIVIGHEISPDIALGGFHAQAGWISFILVVVGLLALAYRVPYFCNTQIRDIAKPTMNARVALLVPLVVLLSSTLLTSALSAEIDWLYPLRVLATGTALMVLWRHYDFSSFRLSPVAILAGVLVFLLWIAIVSPNQENGNLVASQLANASGIVAASWLVFRVLGAVITVPMAEELAFRGYLLTRLTGGDRTENSRLRFSWFAWILSSALFGVLHGDWLAGIIAGLVYGLVRYHRDKVSDAIVAHATTNLLLAGYVLTTGSWSMW